MSNILILLDWDSDCFSLNSGQIFMKCGLLKMWEIEHDTGFFIENIAGNNKYVCQNVQFSEIYFVYRLLNVTLYCKSQRLKLLNAFYSMFLSASEAEKLRF